jgi:putative membrane protein
MNIKKLPALILILLFLILFSGGISIQLLNPDLFQNTEWTPPIFILAAASIYLLGRTQKLILILIIAGIIGFASEVLGANTGFPYGEYKYTSKLGVQIFNVPLVLCCAWIIVTSFSLDVLSFFKIKKIYFPFLFSSITTFYDFLIDPLMAGPLEYWVWSGSNNFYYNIPFQNFIGWFLVSLFISILPWKEWKVKKTSILIDFMLPSFFIFTALVNKMYSASIFGLVMLIFITYLLLIRKPLK